jgi:hypothetical protein
MFNFDEEELVRQFRSNQIYVDSLATLSGEERERVDKMVTETYRKIIQGLSPLKERLLNDEDFAKGFMGELNRQAGVVSTEDVVTNEKFGKRNG